MSFWNYIGTFFLFRWLFGSHKHGEANSGTTNATSRFYNDDTANEPDWYVNSGNSYENDYQSSGYQDDGYSQSHDDFIDDLHDFDMMDDDF